MDIILAGIGGWIIAYLINYLADVLPFSRSLSGVVCIQCQAPIPLSHYLLMRSCPACGKKRALRAWIVQVGYTLAVIGLAISPPWRLGFWVGSGLLAFFALIAVIDMEHRLILHPVSLVGAGIGLLIGIWQKGLVTTLIGGVAGYGIMFVLYYLGILFNRWVAKLRGQETDEVALGFGDVNLAGCLGLMVGWPEIAGVLILAILAGGLTSGIIILSMALLRRYRPMTAIPYAPFLLIAAIVFLYIPNR